MTGAASNGKGAEKSVAKQKKPTSKGISPSSRYL